MGAIISKLYSEEYHILCVGLDGTGKTEILSKIKDDKINSFSINGFPVETITYNNIKIVSFSYGAQGIRYIIRHYYAKTMGIIFVVDSNDRERIDEVKFELFNALETESLKGIPLLIYANKQDLPYSLNIEELSELLNLNSIRDRKYWVQFCCALNSTGINEGCYCYSAYGSRKLETDYPAVPQYVLILAAIVFPITLLTLIYNTWRPVNVAFLDSTDGFTNTTIISADSGALNVERKSKKDKKRRCTSNMICFYVFAFAFVIGQIIIFYTYVFANRNCLKCCEENDREICNISNADFLRGIKRKEDTGGGFYD
eukprot:gene6009-7485_t